MKKKYADYCTNYDSAETLYKQKIKKKEFEAFLNVSTILQKNMCLIFSMFYLINMSICMCTFD